MKKNIYAVGRSALNVVNERGAYNIRKNATLSPEKYNISVFECFNWSICNDLDQGNVDCLIVSANAGGPEMMPASSTHRVPFVGSSNNIHFDKANARKRLIGVETAKSIALVLESNTPVLLLTKNPQLLVHPLYNILAGFDPHKEITKGQSLILNKNVSRLVDGFFDVGSDDDLEPLVAVLTDYRYKNKNRLKEIKSFVAEVVAME